MRTSSMLTSSSDRARKPSMTGPSSFRRIDSSDGLRRTSLIPLRLAPVVLSKPSGPARTSMDKSSIDLIQDRIDSPGEVLPDTKRQSYREVRVSPYERCQRRSYEARGIRANLITPESGMFRGTTSLDLEAAERQQETRLSSMPSMRQQGLEPIDEPATHGERKRLRRKNSLPSMRKPYTESGEAIANKEILELHTLMDERRKGNTQTSKPEAEHHVPAVAPSLHVQARSETLNDIGSIFARPLTAAHPPRSPIISADPVKNPRLSAVRTNSRTSSRVSGWLSNLLPTTSTQAPAQEPFYKCVPHARQRSQSQASLCASLAEMESPTLTSASSPTSKGHSRTLTADSRTTATSPLSTAYGHHDFGYEKGAEAQWPTLTTRPSQVGLAL